MRTEVPADSLDAEEEEEEEKDVWTRKRRGEDVQEEGCTGDLLGASWGKVELRRALSGIHKR